MKFLKTTNSGSQWLGLLASSSTLVCCVLPLVMISLGLGGSLMTLTRAFPGLITISENKLIVFGGAGALLLFNLGIYLYSRNLPCPTDPKLREACMTGRARSFWLLAVSLGVYVVGFTTAFVLPIFN